MRLVPIIALLTLLTLGFSAKAQTREDGVVQPERMLDSKSVQIYPNPAVDFLNVRLDQFPVKNLKLTLHNIIGNEIKIETEQVDDHELRIKVKDLESGYYLLALRDEESNFRGTFKFLKR